MAPFIGPVWGRNGEPFLVAAYTGAGIRPERHRQRTRVVVDDYGNALCYQRRCSKCARWLPLSFDNFSVNSSGKGLGMQTSCMVCNAAFKTLERRRNGDKVRERNRAAYQRRMQDPEYRAKLLARVRRNTEMARERDPDGYRRMQAERARKHRELRRKDPERRARNLETQRINYRLRRERDQGVDLDKIRAFSTVTRGKDYTAYLPAKPLAAAIDAYATRHRLDLGAACALAGIDERQRWAWVNGEIGVVQNTTASRVLTGLGLLWFEVWPELEDVAA